MRAPLAADLLHRKQRGNYPSDIATHIGRWVIIVLLGAAIAQQGDRSLARQAALLLAAALAMYATDAVTIGIELAPITGEAPRRAVLAAVRAGGLIEAVQYLLGFVGALAVMQHAFDQAWMLLSLIFPAALVYLLLKRDREMRGSTRSLLEGLADAVDLRDPYTGGHSRRVTDYCEGILKELNLQGPDATLIVTAARVHDIGKIGIPDMVLQKPGALTPDEWAIMQTHSDRGADLLARYPDFARGVAIVRHHHERWDGKGYPAGLKGYDIPFGARLMAVADSFDAMTSDRPYRPGMSVEKATQILHEGRGVQWDAALVDAFLRSIAVTKTLDAETQRLGDAEQETNLTQRRRDAETQKPKEVCA